jgi:hypothetical protein
MPARAARRLLIIALVVFSALPATAADAACYTSATDAEGNPTGPSYCTGQVWFHQGATKVGNLGATGRTSFPSWDATKPTTSVTGGAGGGYATQGAPRQSASDPATDPYVLPTFEGKFTGDIDNMLAEVYLFAPATAAAANPGAYVGSTELTVDGQKLLMPTQVDLTLQPAGNAVLKGTFALTDIQAAMNDAGLDTGPDAVHTIRFSFGAYGLVSATGVVVYDSSEVPSGITFNAPTLPAGVPVISTGF